MREFRYDLHNRLAGFGYDDVFRENDPNDLDFELITEEDLAPFILPEIETTKKPSKTRPDKRQLINSNLSSTKSLTETTLASATYGATQGILRGLSNVARDCLESKGYSKQISSSVKNLVYYGGYCTAKIASQSNKIEDIDSFFAVLSASAIETGQLWLMNTALSYGEKLLSHAGQKAHAHHWDKAANILTKCGTYLQYGIFAQSSVHGGLIPTAASVVAGSVAEGAVEFLGRNKIC